MDNEQWTIENGKWKMENDLRIYCLLPIPYCLLPDFKFQHVTFLENSPILYRFTN